MKIFNAQLIGISEYNERKYLYFAYKSKFIEGVGCIVATAFNEIPVQLRINEHYDIYMTEKNGYHNLRACYVHTDKNTDRNTIDSN